MKHIASISQTRRVPGLAADPEDVAKYLAQALDLLSALFATVAGWQELQERKNPSQT